MMGAFAVVTVGCSRPKKSSGQYLNRVVESLRNPKDKSKHQATDSDLKANATYYYLLGQQLSSLDDSEGALQAFERVRTFDPKDPRVHYVLAQEYLKRGMSREGVALVRKAIELDPKDRDARILLASLQAAAKKYDEATKIFEQLVREQPDDEETVLSLILLDLEQKRYTVAEQRLREYLKRDPESALAYFYLGRLEQERGRKTQALAAYHQAVELRAGFVQAGTYLGFLQEELGDRKGATDTFQWLAAQTDGARYHKKLGQLLLEQNDYSRALESFLNYERVDGQDLNNKVKIGLLYLELRKSDLAEKSFREVLKNAPDSENVRFYLASVYDEMKKPNEALREYAKIPGASKLYVESVKRRATLLRQTDRKDAAEKLLAEELDKSSGDDARREELFEATANHFASGDNYAKALETLGNGLKEFPDSERLLYARGIVFEKQGDLDGALRAMHEVIAKNPENPGALNFVGFLWADRNERLGEAELLIRRALKSRPKDPYITDSLGWVLYRKGKYREALTALESAFASMPQESVIADHLGDVLVKLGRLTDAKTHYEKALELGPEKDTDRRALESKLKDLEHSLRGPASQSVPAAPARDSVRHESRPTTSSTKP